MFKKLFIAFAAFAMIGLVGCASQFNSKPITTQIDTKGSAYNENFSAALRAMNSLNTVTRPTSDREAGLINGFSPKGAAVEVLFSRKEGMRVTVSVVPGTVMFNTSIEQENAAVINALSAAVK